MTRLDDVFAQLRSDGRRGLAPFVCAGRPSLDRLPELLCALESAGASLVEIGIPFSDPIADGPVIAAAMHEALQSGVTPTDVFAAVAKARDKVDLGLVAMVSMSIVMRTGLDQFVSQARDAGFDGLIVPDAPLDEAKPIADAASRAGISLTLLVAPTTPEARVRQIVQLCTGFVYLLARVGITGERDSVPDITKNVQLIRSMTDLPIACGFGISTADQVRQVVKHADAAIVGSALVKRIESAISAGSDPIATAKAFVTDLAQGLDSA